MRAAGRLILLKFCLRLPSSAIRHGLNKAASGKRSCFQACVPLAFTCLKFFPGGWLVKGWEMARTWLKEGWNITEIGMENYWNKAEGRERAGWVLEYDWGDLKVARGGLDGGQIWLELVNELIHVPIHTVSAITYRNKDFFRRTQSNDRLPETDAQLIMTLVRWSRCPLLR